MDNYAYEHDNKTSGKPYTITRYPEKNKTYLVEVNSRAKLFKRRKFYRNFSLILLILLLILLAIIIALAVLYYKFYLPPKICTSDECLRSAANLRLSIDFNADPCDDFYKYVCGRWSVEHPNHGWFASFSTFSTINERILIASENFLSLPSKADDPKIVNQTRDLYKSCMDIDSINWLGLTPIFKYLKQVELPKIPTIFSENNIENFKFNFLKGDALLKKTFAMDVFIGFMVESNSFNISQNVMYIGTPDRNCPLPSPFKNKHKKDIDYDTVRRQTNENIIKYVIGEIVENVTGNYPNLQLLHQAAEILINMSSSIEILVDNHTTTDYYIGLPHSIIPFQEETNKFLNETINKTHPKVWEEYLDYLFQGTNVTIDTEEDQLYISDLEALYLKKILAYLFTTSDIYLELYIWWAAVYSMIINTSTEFADYINQQIAPFYEDKHIARSRSIQCTILVIDFMPMALSYGIADKIFNNKTKPKVEQMLYDIKDAFVERVNEISWMDEETKQATLEKSKEMISFIGYPEWLFELDALNDYYKNIEIKSDEFLDNMMKLIKNFIPEKLEQLHSVNKRDWRSDPITVNAYNSFPDNAINVPMAILTFPIYNLGLEVLNYGAIGSVLGHELTHGFDNTGRKHDKFGNYKQWWTNDTIETFEEKTQCFIKQYNNFSIDGVEQHVKGDKTLGENLADNGGIGHAYIAYKNYVKKFGQEPKLPGFQNFSQDQMFFIAFGSIWCESISQEDLKNQIEYDEHSPNVVRVLGTLQNTPEFAKAFNCPKGSKLNPKSQRCKIW